MYKKYKGYTLRLRTLLFIIIIAISAFVLPGQVYADSINITQGKTATCNTFINYDGSNISYMAPYGPGRAVDGKTAALNRWQTRKGVDGSYLQVDLGAQYTIDRWVVYHQSYAWNNDPVYTMKAYKLQKSNDGVSFTDVDAVFGNTASITDRTVPGFTARYLRVQITEGCLDANGNHWDCILEFQAFGSLTTAPAVSTTGAFVITGYSALLRGDVTSDGNSDITERGFVYSTTDNPVIGGAGVYSTTVTGTTGIFSEEITTGLVKNTQYYYRAYAKNMMGTTYGDVQSFTTLDLRVDISAPQALNEATLNNKTIVANITGSTFADNALTASNIILVNAPTGVTVGSVNYDSNTQCTITLAYDGTDFDSDISDLTLTIKGAELANSSDLTAANNLTITAVNDDEAIAIVNNSQIVEGEENGKEITITLTGGTFVPSLTLGNWTVSNLPAGVTAGSIIRDSSTGARIVLAGNSTTDYDTDISDITVSCTASEYSDSTGGAGLTQNSGVTFTANIELTVVTSISIKTQPSLVYDEGNSLDLGSLVVTLNKSDMSAEDVAFADFAANGISVDIANGTVLDSTKNGVKITVTHSASGQSVQTNALTVNTPLPVTYTVTFKDWDGSIIDTQTINEGSGASAPADPTRSGYIFTGWDKAFNNITTDLIVTAVYIDDVPPVTDADRVAQDKAALNIGYATGDSADSVTQNLTLIDTGTINGSTITWQSDNTAVITNDGIVTRPAFSSVDTEVTVTAYVYNNEASDTKDFNLKVLRLEQTTYNVSVGTLSGGSINANPTTAVEGTTINLTITPDNGKQLKAGTLKYNDGTQDVNIIGTSFTLPAANVTVTAEFEAIVIPPPMFYIVVASANPAQGGTVSGSGPYGEGASVTVTATANNGYSFINWTENGSAVSTNTTYTFTLGAASRTLTANFSPIPVSYTVTFNKNGGDTEASPITKMAVSGGNVGTLPTAPTRSGYTFTGWNTAANGSGTAFTAATAVNTDLTVYAQWTLNQPAILQSIAITTPAAKLIYTVGDSLDISGMVITGTYSDGFKKVEAITTANVSGFNSSTPAASQILTVTVGGKTAAYTVTIKAAPNTDNDDDDDDDKNSSSGSGGSNTPAPPETPRTETMTGNNAAIAITTTTATADNSGKATASVTQAQVSEAVSEAVAEAARQGNGMTAAVEIKVEAPATAAMVETNLPKAVMDIVAGSNTNTLTVSTPVAVITFDSQALDTIAGAAAADVKISAARVDTAALSEETKQVVGDHPVYNFSVTSGDRTISQFGGNVTVSVPYTPKPGEDTDYIVIYYINAEGKPEVVSNCKYDPATGSITFTTNHFSKYAVGYNKVSFKDVPADAWYGKAVSFIAARGITTGTGNGNFSPEAKLTRGEFLVMLMKAYGIKPEADSKNNFADAGSTYYTGYLAAAKRLGISDGIGNNLFAPEKEITRQEMFTLLYNALKVVGELPRGTEGKILSSFSDDNQVASWAKEAMTLFVKTGTISGSGGKLAPASTTTRSEMAQVLYNLLSK